MFDFCLGAIYTHVCWNLSPATLSGVIMIDQLRELFRYKDLLKQLVVRDLKVRYKNSVLGFFWSLANPLIQVATITIVVKYVLQVEIPNYSAYLLVGLLPWVYFQMALLDSSQVVLLHRDLVRKIYFPREVLPISLVISNLIHFLLALVVFFAYLYFYIHLTLGGVGLMPIVLLLPALIVLQSLLIVGLTFFVSAMNVFYEDTKYILTALLSVLFYLTPVMYPAEFVRETILRYHLPEILYKLYLLNPVNALTDAYRKALLPPFAGGLRGAHIATQPLDVTMLGICAVLCLTFALAGYAYFNARKWAFAERV